MGRSLPASVPKEKLPGIYRDRLDKLSDGLIDHLHQFIQKPLEPGVENARILVFPDEYGENISSIWMYFEGRNQKVDSEDDRLFAGRTLELFSDFSSLPDMDLAVYRELNFVDTLVDLIAAWFAECWWKAGGWYYPIPVEIIGKNGFGTCESIFLSKSCSNL